MKTYILTILIALFLTNIPNHLIAISAKDIIGLTVLKDEINPIKYGFERYKINNIGNTNLSHHSGYQSISAFLNEMNIGKRIVNVLLGYNLNNGMSLDSLLQHIPLERRQQPSNADYEAAILNNYVLVIKMDEESMKRIQQGDTIGFVPHGESFLYQIDLKPETFEIIRNNLFSSKDNETIRGEKRFVYEGISILLKLINSGIDISPRGIKTLLNSIHYISYRDLEYGSSNHKAGKVSSVLKVALSPLIILK